MHAHTFTIYLAHYFKAKYILNIYLFIMLSMDDFFNSKVKQMKQMNQIKQMRP